MPGKACRAAQGLAAVILDLRDPASIAAWYAIAPDRHGPQLAAMAKVLPRFAAAIKAAGQQLRAAKASNAPKSS